MGFTMFEKRSLQKMIRSDDQTAVLRKSEIADEIYEYLKSENLMKQVRDYGLFPTRYLHKINSAENIVLSKFFDDNFNIEDFTRQLGKRLTAPYRIQIDCALLIKHDKAETKFRFVWAQRNLAFNTRKLIRGKEDFDELLSELGSMNRVELTRKIFDIHRTQSCFDRSEYSPMRLLTTVFFLAKI